MIRELRRKKCGVTWRGLAGPSLGWLAYLHNTQHYPLPAAKSTLCLSISLIQPRAPHTIQRIFEMLLITHITLKPTSWWEIICRAIISLLLVVVEDIIISIFIFLLCKPSEPFTEREIRDVLQWIFALEKVLVCLLASLSTCYIFVHVYVHTSESTKSCFFLLHCNL